eukprot:9472844-Pyramimonas_sp.AAC.1
MRTAARRVDRGPLISQVVPKSTSLLACQASEDEGRWQRAQSLSTGRMHEASAASPRRFHRALETPPPA